MKVTATMKAWISEYNRCTPRELATPEGAATLMYSNIDMSSAGYTFAGTAEVTLDLLDQNALVNNKVAALREQAAGIRAGATAKCTRIEGQIQQLLCIENSPAGDA
jgi:hypothetical protein